MEYTAKDKRLYLRMGDRVTHVRYEEWGEGAVVEERTSVVPGGTCLVRILWEDGQQRTFNNDLDHEQCCYFFGVRKIQSLDPFEARETPRTPPRPRRAPLRGEEPRAEAAVVGRASQARGPRTAKDITPPRRRLTAK